MKALTITVAGPTGSGKTIVAHMLRDMLKAYGVVVTLEDDSDWTPNDLQRARLLSHLRPSISIKTRRTGRAGVKTPSL